MTDQAVQSHDTHQSQRDVLHAAIKLLGPIMKRPGYAGPSSMESLTESMETLINASHRKGDVFATRMLFTAVKNLPRDGLLYTDLPEDRAKVHQFLLWNAAYHSILSPTPSSDEGRNNRYMDISLALDTQDLLLDQDHLVDLTREIMFSNFSIVDDQTSLKKSAPDNLRYHVAALLGLRSGGGRVTTEGLRLGTNFLGAVGLHRDDVLRAGQNALEAVQKFHNALGAGSEPSVNGQPLYVIVRKAFNQHCPADRLDVHSAAVAAIDMLGAGLPAGNARDQRILDLIRETYFPDVSMDQVRAVLSEGFTKLAPEKDPTSTYKLDLAR